MWKRRERTFRRNETVRTDRPTASCVPRVPAGLRQRRLCRGSRRSLENDPLSLRLTAPRIPEAGRVRTLSRVGLDSIWDPDEKVFIQLLNATPPPHLLFTLSSQKAELANAAAALRRDREAHEVHKQQHKQVFFGG